MLSTLSALALVACAPGRDCASTLWWVGDAERVVVVGDFNGWNPGIDPLYEVEPGAFRLTLDLPAGDHRYAFLVDGELELDPFQPLVDVTLGEERSLLRVEDCSAPALQLEDAGTDDDRLTVEATFLEGSARLQTLVATLGGDEVAVQRDDDRFVLDVDGLTPGKHTVLLTATDRAGDTAELRVPLWVEEEPFRWDDALIYQIVVDRFAGPLGPLAYDPERIGQRSYGDLYGVLRVMREGFFEELGVDTIWISPVADNPDGLWPGSDGQLYEGYHGYWAKSRDEVEPSFGGELALQALVDEAHARGLRVLLDVVPNHVHTEHPFWAEHPEWFHDNPDCVCGDYTCPWSSEIETCWFTEYLPDLDWEHPEVAPTVVADTLAWAERFDLDGYRVDAVPMMTRAAVRELSYAINETFEQGPTDFYTLGETYTGADGLEDIAYNLGPYGLDGQFEFPIMWALRELVASEGLDATVLADAVAEAQDRWEGSGSVMAPFVGNHDTSRFLSEAAFHDTTDPWGAPPPQPTGDLPYQKLVMAQAVALTLPGAPVVYQGDELGLAGATDPDCRRPLPFELSEQQAWTRERVARIGRARRDSLALRRGDWQLLLADGPVYAHLRVADGETAVVALNASSEPRTAQLLPGSWLDVIEEVPVTGSEVELAPWTALVLVEAP